MSSRPSARHRRPATEPPRTGLRAVPDRTVRDARGRTWEIREVDTARTPGAPRPRGLICDAGAVIRRAWHFPPDWRDLDDLSLLELCGGVD